MPITLYSILLMYSAVLKSALRRHNTDTLLKREPSWFLTLPIPTKQGKKSSIPNASFRLISGMVSVTWPQQQGPSAELRIGEWHLQGTVKVELHL